MVDRSATQHLSDIDHGYNCRASELTAVAINAIRGHNNCHLRQIRKARSPHDNDIHPIHVWVATQNLVICRPEYRTAQ